MNRYIARSFFTLVFALLAGSVLAITIPTVPVGDIGNANDPSDGDGNADGVQNYGGVGYAYNIGKFEVTVAEYTDFLNAVADDDPHELYDDQMALDLNSAGIARSGSPGVYTYSVIGSPNHPVTYVDWGDAARFVNWLHNSQPTGPQDNSTTEDGAYTFNENAFSVIPRNEGARWFLPTENEWYKAAYYQPSAQSGDSDSYWLYPMKTNSVPYSDQPPGSTPDNTRVGNFQQNDGVANGYDDGWAVTGTTTFSNSQNYLTDVGAYSSSPSYYGTFDQGGNVSEWLEDSFFGFDGYYRGGDFAQNASILSSPARQYGVKNDRDELIGFRVANYPEVVPEPGGIALCLIGLVAALLPRKSR
jgi:formylglycine-generating enzyme required for sulfatase activity